MNCRVVRLAGVVHKFCPAAGSAEAAQLIAEHFCQDRWLKAPFNQPQEFEIHTLKHFNMSGFAVNSWVRCKTPTLTLVAANEQRQMSGVIIEQDINTLAEEMPTSNYSAGNIGKFYSLLPSNYEQILALFFPAE